MTRMPPPGLRHVVAEPNLDRSRYLRRNSQSGERLVRGSAISSTCQTDTTRPQPRPQGRHTMRRIITTAAATVIAAAAFVVTTAPALA